MFNKISKKLFCVFGVNIILVGGAYAANPIYQANLTTGFNVHVKFQGTPLTNQKVYYIVTDKNSGKVVTPQTLVVNNGFDLSFRNRNYLSSNRPTNSITESGFNYVVTVKGIKYSPDKGNNQYQIATSFEVLFKPGQVDVLSGNPKGDTCPAWSSALDAKFKVYMQSANSLKFSSNVVYDDGDGEDASLHNGYAAGSVGGSASNGCSTKTTSAFVNVGYVLDTTTTIPYVSSGFASPTVAISPANTLSQQWRLAGATSSKVANQLTQIDCSTDDVCK